VGRTRKSSAESGARGAHQGQYQPRLKRMPHGLHSSAGLQRERDSGGSGRRLGRDPRCAARTRDTHPRGRPPPPNPCATWACPARASQRASQGASRGATKAAALQPSSGQEQTRRRNAATPRAFSCAVTHDGLAHFWPRGAAAAPAAGAAIQLIEKNTQGCSNCRRAARARARQAAALRRQVATSAQQARTAAGTGAERRRKCHDWRCQVSIAAASARPARVVRIGVDDRHQPRVRRAVGEHSERFAVLTTRTRAICQSGAHWRF